MNNSKQLFVVVIIAIIFIAGILVLSTYDTQMKTIKGDVRYAAGTQQATVKETMKTETTKYVNSGTATSTAGNTITEKYDTIFNEEAKWDAVNQEQYTQPSTYLERQVIVMSPDQVSRRYYDAKRIVERSRCYFDLADLREITYFTSLTGEKFASIVIPNDDYTIFQVLVVVKLEDPQDRVVYYKEVPVVVDVTSGQILNCPAPLQVNI